MDVLAFAAHPDDVELCAGGTMCLLAKQGYKTGIVDLTRGELGSRGTPALRMQEAEAASKIMGVAAREHLTIPDGNIENTKANQLALIRTIRRYRPHIVLMNAPVDRHPDHPAAATLTKAALYYAGLIKIETKENDGSPQEPWRPDHMLHYMHTTPFEPSFIVDVSGVWEERIAAMKAFRSQFFNEGYETDEPETFISNSGFFDFIEARARSFGYLIGATYGEPFLYHQGPVGVNDLVAALSRSRKFK